MSSNLLIDEPPLLIQPTLAVLIGLNEAIFLQQLHYWLNPRLNKNKLEGCFWVHNTYEQWQKQFPFWGERTIRRIVNNLEKVQVLKSRVTTTQFRKTKFYTINYTYLNSLKIASSTKSAPPGQSGQLSLPIPVEYCGQSDQVNQVNEDRTYNTYTETTTETTPHPPLTPPPDNTCRWQEEEEDLIKMMLTIWDETIYQILNPGKNLRLTKERRTQMERLLNGFFDGKIEGWEGYCRLIAECSFLMGQNARKFKITLDWALIPKNALKVLENDFYSPPPAEPVLAKEESWEDYESVLKQELKDWPYANEWLLICEALVKYLGQVTFAAWFQQIKPKKISSTEVTLLALNNFTRDYILKEFEPALKTCVSAIYPQEPHIEIEVDPSLIICDATILHPTQQQ